jgi:NAD(P)-dependent dehydrogenase (short-subunit alcohol dehydrogenase family)
MSKVFLVTGSSRGLGRAICQAALDEGHQVTATARRPEQLSDLVRAFGASVRAVPLDVTDFAAAQSAADEAVSAFGRLDVVINNAGYGNLVSVEDIDIADFRAQVDTNLFGVVNVCKAVIPVLRGQGDGHIINVSSVGGRLATAGLSAYQAAKWAVGGFTEVLVQELAPLGIKVTVVEPGGMRTDWAGSSMQIPPVSEPYQVTVGVLERLFRRADSVPAGDPAKVARAILAVAGMNDPPVRLLLGSDAVSGAGRAVQARAAEDASWLELSLSTDRDDATEQERDPLASAT